MLAKDPLIDAVILGCTHYPLLMPKIQQFMPQGVSIVAQGSYVAHSLQDYFLRHPEIETLCSRQGTTRYLTTELPLRFQETAQLFLNEKITAEHVVLG